MPRSCYQVTSCRPLAVHLKKNGSKGSSHFTISTHPRQWFQPLSLPEASSWQLLSASQQINEYKCVYILKCRCMSRQPGRGHVGRLPLLLTFTTVATAHHGCRSASAQANSPAAMSLSMPAQGVPVWLVCHRTANSCGPLRLHCSHCSGGSINTCGRLDGGAAVPLQHQQACVPRQLTAWKARPSVHCILHAIVAPTFPMVSCAARCTRIYATWHAISGTARG